MKKLLAMLLVLCLMVGMMPAALAAGSYVDVPTNEWYADEVAYVTEKGLMDGIDDGKFGPDVDVSRAMVVTILHRVEGEPTAAASPFADVPANEWYTKAVAWAAANGIVEGVSDTRFAPTEDITREQLAAILYRYADYKGYDVSARANLGAYADAGNIRSWALEPMQWAVAVGLIDGVTETALQPAGTANRAQLAAIIYRFCNNVSAVAGEDKDDTYTVTFMLNYGTAGEYTSVEVEAGAKVAAPANPTRSGYSFRAWCTDTAGNSRYNFNAPVESDLTLYASWNKQSTGGGYAHYHSWTAGTKVDATCTTDGSQDYTCSCGQTKTDVIPATGHSWDNVVWSTTKAANCIETGTETASCANNCGETKTRIIDALGHELEKGDKVDGDTCSGEVYAWTCSRNCDYTENRAESAEGHTESALARIDDKIHGTECTVCYAVITTEEHSMKIVGGDESSWKCESCEHTATYEAKIGTEYYATVADALVEAVSGDTVTILKNITVDATVEINKSITLDGNGYYILAEDVNAMNVTAGSVTLNDLSVVSQREIALNVSSVENLTVNGGTIRTGAARTDGKDGEGSIRIESATGDISITNATLSGGIHILNYVSANTLNITGNTINFNWDGNYVGILVRGDEATMEGIGENDVEELPSSIWVVQLCNEDWTNKRGILVDGAAVAEIEGVQYADLSTAIINANADTAITLLKDATIANAVEAKANITITGDFAITGLDKLTAAEGKTVTIESDPLDFVIANTERYYVVANEEDMVAFAKQVNDGVTTYSGETVKLTAALDLKDVTWTPIGNVNSYPSVTFAGTFDGQNHTISNLTANAEGDGGYASAGLFGSITGKVKNVILDKATVISTHYAGGIVGYSSANVGMEVSGCKVMNSTITSTPEEISEGTFDNGDKVGGIIGYCVAGDVVNGNTVENTVIKGYRDVGGIVGYATGTVTNNTAKDVTLQVNDEHNYKNYDSFDKFDFGEIVGEGTPGEGNTATNVVIETKAADSTGLAGVVGSADAVEVELGTGTYELPTLTNKDVTITGGEGEEVIIDTTAKSISSTNANITFEGVTVKFGTESYKGFQHSEKVVYKDCVIEGTQFLYSDTEFINCTFKIAGDAYAVWTYGAENVTFTGCTFDTDGKAILVYIEAAHTATINVSDCTFKATTNRSKAAIEVGESAYGNKANYTLNISTSTAESSFVTNNSTSNLWGNKNSMDTDHLNVIIDGVDVY